jgi:hypothetical protein
MFRPIRTATPRKGVILLVVLSMLMLFAIVGVSFVIYANAEATTNRALREASNGTLPDLDPEQMAAFALGQIIYDVPDDSTGVFSALRGKSLARNMYGWNDTPNALNNDPYSGPGRLHVPSPFPGAGPGTQMNARDNAYVLSNMLFYDPTNPGATMLWDPEHLGQRPAIAPNETPEAYVWRTLGQRGPFVGENPSYTYPDPNSLFLAAIKTDGTVLIPSFHRPWAGFGGLGPGNVNWDAPSAASPWLKYLVMRPRNADMGPGFPRTQDPGGDVKNLPWAPGGCDSIWIDIGAPVMTAPDGRRFKMLVAPLILDLDNKLNLAVAGNIMGANNTHNSNQGWGPWEMNVAKILDQLGASGKPEYLQLFLGKADPANPGKLVLPGKYGYPLLAGGQPVPPALLTSPWAAPFTAPHKYADVDYNGGPDAVGVAAVPIEMPGSTATLPTVPYQTTPAFPKTFSSGTAVELWQPAAPPPNGKGYHASGYNPFRPPANTRDNRYLPVSDLQRLQRQRDTGSEALTAYLLQLLPNNLVGSDPASLRRRLMVTPMSFDLDRPAMTPYVWDPATAPGTYSIDYTAAPGYPLGFPTGPLTKFDAGNRVNPPPALSEFDANTWRSKAATFGKVNLNRPLTAYGPGAAFHQAELDRQNLAKDIFNRLCLATGAVSPFILGKQIVPNPPAGKLFDPLFEASRYLAQLAVNMVDYIDGDDYNSVFIWNPIDPTVADPFKTPDPATAVVNNFAATEFKKRIVIGTEAPKLVLNEVYVQYDNDPADGAARRALNYNVNVWIELLNPFIKEAAPVDNTAYLFDPNAATPWPIYQVMITDPAAGDFLTPDNVLGDPSVTMNVRNLPASGKTDFGDKTTFTPPYNSQVAPVDSNYNDPTKKNQGFYVLGPNTTFIAGADPTLPTTYKSSSLTYKIPANAAGAALVANQKPTILLRRLLYPSQPPNPALPPGTGGALGNYDPTIGPYNPYITIDFLESVQAIEGRSYNTTGGAIMPAALAMNQRSTVGRRQPYDVTLAAMSYAAAPAGVPMNSFYRHNYNDPNVVPTNTTAPSATLQIPFNWLPHLDRQLVSPVELMQVSAHKPHELTRVFVQTVDQVTKAQAPYLQSAAWTNEQTRLYRFFEMVETASRVPGAATGGRIPGRININTLAFDAPEVFLAMCDAQPGNSFFNPIAGQGDLFVQDVFTKLMQYRTPNPLGTPGINDRPFKSFGIGPYSGPGAGDAMDRANVLGGASRARGINDTLFVQFPDVGGAHVSSLYYPTLPPNTPPTLAYHPYQQRELLNKVSNNLTTRSNTFAVFLTIGFFEVTDETTRPVKLGPEINAAQGTNIRHRAFAIVDRTNLEVFGQPVLTATALDTKTPGSYPYEVQLDALVNPNQTVLYCPPPSTTNPFTNGFNPNTGRKWAIQPGSVLVIDPNTQAEETVTVYTKPTGGTFAQFLRPHAQGALVISRGNPGPWPRYDPRQDTPVVPFFAIID